MAVDFQIIYLITKGCWVFFSNSPEDVNNWPNMQDGKTRGTTPD